MLGVWDLYSRWKINRAIADFDQAIRIELGRVSTFQDFGLAILAQAFGETRAGRIAVRGLRLHQLRILRYFGVDPIRLRGRAGLELDLATAVAAADVG